MIRFDLITIFPKIFDSYVNESILKRAQEKGNVKIVTHDLRDFSNERHRKVDDKPFGGGPGMVLQIGPLYEAVKSIKRHATRTRKRMRIILFSTRGKKLDGKMAKRLARFDQLILICGRYEGVDERVAQYVADEEVSIGDYVLSGGELPAMVLTEAVARFIPGVLGKYESLEDVKGSYPVYTRPEVFRLATSDKRQATRRTRGPAWRVPPVLLSGDHARIAEWRTRHRGAVNAED